MLERNLLNGVNAILGADGLLVNSGGGAFTFNVHQYEYSLQVAKGICRFRDEDLAAGINMLQAATGTGKSLGYLVPALLHSALTGSRVVVSTYTRHLQHQILTKDALLAEQLVAKHTGKSLTVCRRVGRQNYLSRSACVDFLAKLEAEDCKTDSETAALYFMGQLCDWLDSSNTQAPILDDFLFGLEGDAIQVPEGIDRKLLCIDSAAPDEEIEAYQADVRLTQKADVVVTNHALTMLNAYRWASILDGERPTDILICDEADRLPDAAESVMSADLSLHRLVSLADRLSSVLGGKVVSSISALQASVQDVGSEGKQLAVMPSQVIQQASKTLTEAMPAALDFAQRVTSPQRDFDDHHAALMAEFLDGISDLQRICSTATDAANTCLISWSPVRHYPSLRIGQPDPARVINRLIAPRNWDEEDGDGELLPPRSYLRSCLFTSATLATPGKTLPAAFDAFANQVGVIRHCKKGSSLPIHNACVDLYRCFEPQRFGQMTFVLPDPQVHTPTLIEQDADDFKASTSPEWLDYCAMMITAAAEAPGRTLVLTLSFRDTAALAQRLDHLPNLIVHRKGDQLATLKARYQDNDRAVLITPAGWEGLDLPGMVNNLVITRIPASPPDSFRATLLELTMKQKGFSADKIRSTLYATSMESTRRKLAQGLGRGIRQATDSVRVWIGDPRFPSPDGFEGSLDEVLMKPRRNAAKRELLSCIPTRFRSSFEQSKILLADGSLHTPEVF